MTLHDAGDLEGALVLYQTVLESPALVAPHHLSVLTQQNPRSDASGSGVLNATCSLLKFVNGVGMHHQLKVHDAEEHSRRASSAASLRRQYNVLLRGIGA